MDFFFWGAMSDLVYDGTEIQSEEELVARIAAAAGHIRDNADTVSPSLGLPLETMSYLSKREWRKLRTIPIVTSC